MSNTKIQMPSPNMWIATKKLSDLLAKAVSDETSLIKVRKQQEKDLEKLGREEKTVEGQAWQHAASALKLTEMAIDDVRASKIYYADKLPECVAMAANGMEYSQADLDSIDGPRKPVDAPLFQAAMKNLKVELPATDVGESDEAAAGKKKKGKGGVPEGGISIDWSTHKLDSPAIGLTQKDQDALREVGLLTFASVIEFVQVHMHELKTIDGLSKSGQTTLFSRLPAEKPAAAVEAKPEGKGKGSKKPAAK